MNDHPPPICSSALKLDDRQYAGVADQRVEGGNRGIDDLFTKKRDSTKLKLTSAISMSYHLD
jgi:hypothetical protein